MDDKVLSARVVHTGWLSLEMVTVRFKEGRTVEREVVEHPSGVAVLAYDPERRVAMLVSQCRIPVLKIGEESLIEVIAGALDDDDAEKCARREALEEGGLQLQNLEKVAETWATPSSSTERVTSFLASYCEADRIASGGGLQNEAEYLSLREVPLLDLCRLADAGQIHDGKALLLIQTLRIRKPDLFSDLTP